MKTKTHHRGTGENRSTCSTRIYNSMVMGFFFLIFLSFYALSISMFKFLFWGGAGE